MTSAQSASTAFQALAITVIDIPEAPTSSSSSHVAVIVGVVSVQLPSMFWGIGAWPGIHFAPSHPAHALFPIIPLRHGVSCAHSFLPSNWHCAIVPLCRLWVLVVW